MTCLDNRVQGHQMCLAVCLPSASMHSVFVLLMLVLWGHAPHELGTSGKAAVEWQ